MRAFLVAVLLAAVPASAEQVIFTEVHYNPPAGEPEFIEIYNNTATPFDIGTWYFSDGIEYTFPDFNPGDTGAHILKPFERILVSDVDEATLRGAYSIPPETRVFGPYTGALDNGGETVALSDKNGTLMTELSYDDGGKWPAAADGTGHTLTRIRPNLSNGGWRNWRSSLSPGGTPGSPPPSDDNLPTTTTRIAEVSSDWKYDQNADNNDLGTAWRELAYNDDAWPEGPGTFGVDTGDTFGTPWTSRGRFTYYLRREFQQDGPFLSATMDVRAHIDDGLVIYLNGQEVARFNMPGGTINFDTPASDRREWEELVDITAAADVSGALQAGTNVIAVEVHNDSSGGSDIGFGAEIDLTTTAPPPGALPELVISEVHFGGDGRVDWVELYARGQAVTGLEAMTLSSQSDRSDAIFLSGSISGGGYASFDVDFPVEASGDIDLFLALGSTILDAHKLDRDHGQESFQSLPPGGEFYSGAGHTRDAANDPSSRVTDIVINEIMYDAPSDQRGAEFIELYNRGVANIDLSGWSFTDGVSFDFPPGTSLDPGAYLVITADLACFTSAHGAIPALGDWGGQLRDGGELLRLEDSLGNLADEVDYLPEGDWPNMADGDGASMELRHPDMDNSAPTAWADSDESQKSAFQNFSYTAPFEDATHQGLADITGPQELHAHLVGDAHLIIRNVTLKQNNIGSNLIDNPTVMSPDNSSALGWVTQGTHHLSFMTGGELNLISTGHGDNKGNQGQVDIDALTIDESYTLSFEARWVSGKSRIIFQTLDHGFGTSFLLPIPENLGTPGAANSSLLATAAPTVTAVTHSPAVPLPTTPVTVSARVGSSAALDSVELVHRLDNSAGNGAWVRTPMSDDGGGQFSVSISDYDSQGNIVEFYVEAKSGAVSTFQPRFGPERPAMWIADEREMPDTLLRERFIISEHDRAALTLSTGHSPTFAYNFPKMSNQFFNCTFIANESEIYYNAEIRKSGSPFTRSSNANIDHGKWKLPGDRLFRGRRRSVIDASGTPEGSGTPRFYDDRIARYFLYQLGHPVNEMEFVHVAINTVTFRQREDHEPISNDMLNRNFPGGSDGTLLRIDDEWRFTSDNGTSTDRRDADWSYKDTDNPIRYHSEWILRTRESDYDYDNFIEYVRTLDEDDFDEETIDRLADLDMLSLNAAVRGYDADWDTITVSRGKNAYFFRPKEGNGWLLLHWDGDRVFENTTQAFIGNRVGVKTLFNKPYVKRRLNYYLTKLLDEHTKDSARTLAWLHAEEDAVAGSGVTSTTSHYTNWFTSREGPARIFVTDAVTDAAFAISTSNADTADHSIDLAGTAPAKIYSVQVLGQPEATSGWTDTTGWTLTGVQLQSGANTLEVQGIDHDGKLVDQVQFVITKTSNAPPVVVIDPTPQSTNVSLGETLLLDANSSYDPEGGALGFAWQVSPAEGVNLVPNGASATATFTQPGLYTFTATASDDQPQDTVRSVAVAVYGPASFSTFGGNALEGFWDFSDIAKHPNASDDPYYSLEDHPGRLTIHIPVAAQVALPPAVQYIDFGDTWKYEANASTDLTGIFNAPAFDDSAWPSGPGFLGYGNIGSSGPPAPGWGTDDLDATGRRLDFYFRKEFDFTGETVGSQISIDHLIDDGVVYYLNGQELGRVRIPAGPFDATTLGIAPEDEDAIEESVLNISGTGSLIEGTNVLAAQVQNESPGSSDMVFGMRLSIAEGTGGATPGDSTPAWVHRALPASGDWILQTEVKLEGAQFGDFLAGLLIEADEDGTAARYGIAFDGGTDVTVTRGAPGGDPLALASVPAIATDIVTVRIERADDQLLFSWDDGAGFTQIHQAALPANTTFGDGGVFASTSSEIQTVSASFDYLMLIDSTPTSGIPLVVSEIMYHPTSDPALEFLELYNAGATPLDLSGYKTVATEPFDEFVFPAFTLQPGAYGLLVANQGAFITEYGAALAPQIIGQWPGGVLRNSGELVTITDASGALVTSFSYDDESPWPLTPDGDGPSLVILDETAGLDPNLGTNWRASVVSGGSPGMADAAGPDFDQWMTDNGFVDPDAEYAGTGLSNLLAYALGRDLASSVAPQVTDAGGFALFSHRQRIGDPSLVYTYESSHDLDTWTPATDLIAAGSPVPNGDGTQTVNLVSNLPTAGREDTYYRMRVTDP